jgi:hypothetical protein
MRPGLREQDRASTFSGQGNRKMEAADLQGSAFLPFALSLSKDSSFRF